MLLDSIIAKKNTRGTKSLLEHSIEIANISFNLSNEICDDETIKWLCYVSGLFHDIGKISQEFQLHLKNDSKDIKYPIHNIFGACLFSSFVKAESEKYNVYINKVIAKTILYHHPISYENLEEQFDLIDNNIEDPFYKECINELIAINNDSFPKYKIKLKDDEGIDSRNIIQNKLRYYEENLDFSETKQDIFNIVSNIIRFSDCLNLFNKTVEEICNRKFSISESDIVKPIGYDNRFDKQLEFAKKMSKSNNYCFESQTGFGKTMLGLLYSLLANNSKTYWICPRNSIAEGVYHTLTKEVSALNLSDKISVGLLLTNQYKYGDSNCDIIITNIDNFLRPLLQNDSIERSYSLFHSTCIFDEFHEYVMSEPIMALFDIMIRARNRVNTKTLFISATPIYDFFKGLKNIEVEEYFDEKIANRRYKVEFIDEIKDIDKNVKKDGSLITTTSTKFSQDLVSERIADKTFHSRFLASDRERLFRELEEEFGKKSSKTERKSVVSATNIITTGIDISFKNIMICSPIPDRTVQSIGRCNRWDENAEISVISFVSPRNAIRSDKEALKKQLYTEISDTFYEFLKEKLNGIEYVTFNDLYSIRKEYYDKNAPLYAKFYKCHRKESFSSLSKIDFQMSFIKDSDSDEKFIGGNKLRDNEYNNFYCVLKDKNDEYIDELFEGNDLIFPFDRYVKHNKDGKKLVSKFENEYMKLYKNNKDYYKHKKQAENLRNSNRLFDNLLSKAKSSKTPIHIPFVWYYDNKLGIVKQ